MVDVASATFNGALTPRAGGDDAESEAALARALAPPRPAAAVAVDQAAVASRAYKELEAVAAARLASLEARSASEARGREQAEAVAASEAVALAEARDELARLREQAARL